MRKILPGLFVLSLIVAACALSPAQQAAIVQAAGTLGAVAAANDTTAAKLIAGGQLVCKDAAGYKAILGVNVTGTAGAVMQSICAGLGAAGAVLPASVDPASVPAVTVALKPGV